ncbi:heparan-alpha-glucosaminide N-acetyltransferase-like [Sesamum indicum]|uniref:Heparan-alpha-glucosaminide N-acetyltransferase-like n=1 Tax=Sesamum indicum TaxID=4182 RepID=A0A6I9SY82_SESIN|nr:heparan-alpha-glucosaminide N-acetyltransferase-like [Sesamum indicum]
MASYQLIKEAGEDGTLDLQRKDCTLHVEGCNGDVESAFQKIYPSSPPLRPAGSDTAANGASRGTSPSARLASLDVFRGLTVALMILVDDAGGILPTINHSPWNGLTLADVVMPFFLFMVGVSLALVYKNMSWRGAASKKAIFRALKLLILGVFLQGGYFHGINNLTYGVDMDLIRWMGILQRIAVAYLVAAMCEIWLRNDEKVSSGLSLLKKYKWHWIMMLVLTTIYMLLLYGLFVPDWEYQIPLGAPSEEAKIFMVKCGVHGDTGPACNAAGMIDRMILGVQHLYRRPIYARTQQCSINSPDYGPLPPNAPSWCQAPFDPEGILSTMMAIVTCLIGLQFGHVVVHFKDHRNRLLLWLAPSSAFIVLGLLCDIFGMHINKALYSFSYTCVTSGLAGFLLATIYLVVDVYGCRRFALVLEWMGMNALLIYILVACNILPLILQGFYWRDPRNNILSLVGIRKQAQ